jgi:hypothetical protein
MAAPDMTTSLIVALQSEDDATRNSVSRKAPLLLPHKAARCCAARVYRM